MNQNGNLAVPGAAVCGSFGVQTEELLKYFNPIMYICFVSSLVSLHLGIRTVKYISMFPIVICLKSSTANDVSHIWN